MRLQPVFLALGYMLILTGLAMIPSALIDFADSHESWGVFALTGFILVGIGGVCVLSTMGQTRKTGQKEAFLLTVLVWVILPLAAAFPFLALGFTFTDAVFESVSGLTTTGSTIITGLQEEQRGLLLWRAILQWIGGVGIIVTAIAILPMLRVGGMQLFQLESSDVSGKFLPRVTEIASQITMVYVALSVLCAMAYGATGMSAFDAIAHAMTTMAAGGYSTYDSSMGEFADTAAIEVAIFFMICAGLPFGALVMMLHGKWNALWNDPQPRVFLMIMFVAFCALLAYIANAPDMAYYRSDEHMLRDTLFSVVSVTTGTGYAVVDYGQWGAFPETVFLALMFVGGCAGSAACGMKVFRLEIMARSVMSFASGLLSPNRITTVRYNGQAVRDDVLQSVLIFVFLYLVTFAVAAVLLSLMGLDTLTAYSAAATSVSNVGPGLGPMIGPSGTFQGLPDPAKWVCIATMLLGRLEFVTVFVVLSPRFWRI